MLSSLRCVPAILRSSQFKLPILIENHACYYRFKVLPAAASRLLSTMSDPNPHTAAAAAAAAADSAVKPGEVKDKRQASSDDDKGNKNNRKKTKRISHTREAKSRTVPHAGSYINPEMRERFGIAIAPELLVQPPPDETAADEKRFKRKIAFLLGYLGTEYTGFQINAGQRTIQAEMELAFIKYRLLDVRNIGFPNKYSWSTSGRTDKGVHAAAQVCSAKIEMTVTQTVEDVREAVNAALPADIRVLDALRVTKGFCAKTQRDRVRYQYLIPSFLLAPNIRQVFESMGVTGMAGRRNNSKYSLTRQEIEQVQAKLSDYRATSQQLETLRESLQSYEGTHSFHNYSKGVKPNEARGARYIISFQAEDPIVVNGMEWIPTQVLGQSFLLHQIRKMVCMAIEVARGVVPLSTLQLAMKKDATIGIGVAPAQGLFMEMSYYLGYNTRKSNGNSDHPDIVWHDPDTDANKRWKEFRNGTIMPHIVSEEQKEGNFVEFLYLQEYCFERDVSYDPEKPSFSTHRHNIEKDGDDEDEEESI